MRIALLAPGTSIHTLRWHSALLSRGHDALLFTQHPPPAGAGLDHVVQMPFRGPLGYFLNVRFLKQQLARWKPDVLHAHYASGYGTMARLARVQPTLLSVWGSDVFDFPLRSAVRRCLVMQNLLAATRIASTSEAMARQVLNLAPHVRFPAVTPFGVDCRTFAPTPKRDPDVIVIGTVKSLAPVYGIDILIEAFAKLIADESLRRLGMARRLRLVVAGDGPQKGALIALAERLGIAASTTFAGQVPHARVPDLLNTFDIFVAASRQESFGVAVIEASACGLPVVVTEVGGLPEVVRQDRTGLIVPPDNSDALATAIRSLVLDGSYRSVLGKSGRVFVAENYDWETCVGRMEMLYGELVAEGRSRQS